MSGVICLLKRFGVGLLHFSFFFVVLLNLSLDLLFNIIGSSSARFVKKITQKDLHERWTEIYIRHHKKRHGEAPVTA